ncbi:hypothetical protein ZWY2020_006457 [Hordeum vulgare]|nr:hypothetical protein ZWY2020_006457 [Hordeum vulgare]
MSKKRFKNRSTSPQNIEVDSDSESVLTPKPEQEELEEEEITAADDLSLLDRLHNGGLPHVLPDNDDDDAFIDDSDDHDAFIDPEAYIDEHDCTRGSGRGRAVAATPSEVEATRSPPPPQADSPEHRTSRVDSSKVKATRCEEGYEEDAAKVSKTECHRLLQNFRYEARVQAVRDYYATRRIKKDKAKCRDSKMEKEHYMKVPPRWCVDKMDCWEALVDQWCSETCEASHNNAKEKRGKMVGVTHHQVSINLIQFGENWARHNKTEVPQMYDLYAMAHTASYKNVKAFSESDLEHPENFTNISSHHKLVKYRDHGKARKGEDFNPERGAY